MTGSNTETGNASLNNSPNQSFAASNHDSATPEGSEPPLVFQLPLGPDQAFIGRESDLKALAAILLPSESENRGPQSNRGAAIIHTGQGGLDLGGTGKSQLAAEFCLRYGQFFQSVHWINAARGELEVEIARSGATLKLQTWSDKTAEQARLTYSAWVQGAPRLVVLDDPIYPAATGPLLNSLPENVRVLVTARQGGWQGKLGLREYVLNGLTPEIGRQLLRKAAPHLEYEPDDALDTLGKRLGWQPLALKLAGGYLHATLQTRLDTLGQDDTNAILTALYKLCWQQLANEEEITPQRLLLICSWLAPNEPLPLDLLASALGVGTETHLLPALKHLYRMGFLGCDDANHYHIHARLAEFIQRQPDAAASNEALDAAANAAIRISHSLSQPADISPYRVHLETLATAAERRELDAAKTLYSEAGYYQSKFAEYERARTSLGKALILIEKISGLENTEYTENLNNLGSVLHKLENHEGAKKCFEQAIIMDQKILDKNDPAIATGHNNLGQVLLDMNNPEGALLHLEKAVEINTVQLGEEHPLVASGYYNIGVVLHAVGDLPRAKAVLERVLAVRKSILCDLHPDVADSHHSLGMVLQNIGDLPGAKTHYEQAASIWDAVLGPDNLQSAIACTSLAGILHVTGDHSGAKAHYERSLQIFEAALPPDNQQIRDVQLQLELLKQGLTYPELLQKMEGGEDLPDELLALMDKFFGRND